MEKTVLIIFTLALMTSGSGQYRFSETGNVSCFEISEQTAGYLQFLREEEYLAHDVYNHFFLKYGLKPFENIQKSELIHTSAIQTLLERYNLADPSESHVMGIFQNDDLQHLYHDLIVRGAKSVIEALRVSIYIEEQDIKDLNDALKTADEGSDIYFVLNNLKRASGNHIRTFHSHLKGRGYDYNPSVLGEEEFQIILQK